MNDNKAAAAYHPGDAPVTRPDLIEDAAREAFWTDDVGGHVKGRWSWETIPEEGRENYRRLVRVIYPIFADALAAEQAPAEHKKSSPMNEIDLDAIFARAEAAASGPWVAEAGEEAWGVSTSEGSLSWDDHSGEVFAQANADFIAHAREDIPALLAALTAERARADVAERDVKRYEARARENRKLLDQYAGQLAKIPHAEDCPIGEWNEAAGHSMPCACWKSAAPIAEQGADS